MVYGLNLTHLILHAQQGKQWSPTVAATHTPEIKTLAERLV